MKGQGERYTNKSLIWSFGEKWQTRCNASRIRFHNFQLEGSWILSQKSTPLISQSLGGKLEKLPTVAYTKFDRVSKENRKKSAERNTREKKDFVFTALCAVPKSGQERWLSVVLISIEWRCCQMSSMSRSILYPPHGHKCENINGSSHVMVNIRVLNLYHLIYSKIGL